MANTPILTVYDDNGNEIPIPAIRGEKGEKGDSYVLTQDDKREIAEIVTTLITNGDGVSY